MEVPAGPPRGRLAVDLVDEVVGQHVVVAAVMVLCGRGVGRHRQEQHYSQHLLFVLDRLGRKNESSGQTAGSVNHKQLRRFLNSESETTSSAAGTKCATGVAPPSSRPAEANSLAALNLLFPQLSSCVAASWIYQLFSTNDDGRTGNWR